MWTCPNCKREFKRKNQSHYCSEKPKSIEEYIETSENKEILKKLDSLIFKILKNSTRHIAWSMPTYRLDGKNIIHFCAFKNHIGIYPGEEAVLFFEDKLKNYRHQKGSIQFPYSDVNFELICEITNWCKLKHKKRP